MRKGFQKLAAEMLVEICFLKEQNGLVTVDDGSSERRYSVDAQSLKDLEIEIDKVGDSPTEIVSKDPSMRAGKALIIDKWIEACTGKDTESRKQLTKIFEENLLRDPNCIQKFGSYADRALTSGADYTFSDKLIVDLAQFRSSVDVASTTGLGEYAVAFLFGLTPAMSAGFDLSTSILPGARPRQYTIKHSAKNKLDTFIYHFSGSKRVLKKINDQLSNLNAEQAQNPISKDDLEVIKAAKAKIGLRSDPDNPYVPLTKKQLAAAILGLRVPDFKDADDSSRNAPTRWSLVCSVPESKSFKFKAFSISNHLRDSDESKIDILQTQIVISESKKSIISELSRRDRQEVETIARQVAQEVLEDELGDDFDKAVRREMLSSFKDKDVESGVADISRDFMRKFYRSLGTASSSPLDKVKV